MQSANAETLRAWRTGAGKTQEKMADAMGLSRRTYINLESGGIELKPTHIEAALKALGRWRDQGQHKLKLFLAQFRDPQGKWSPPWTVWAEDFAQAVQRFHIMASVGETAEIRFRSLPRSEAETYHHAIDYSAAVLEHRGKEWPEFTAAGNDPASNVSRIGPEERDDMAIVVAVNNGTAIFERFRHVEPNTGIAYDVEGIPLPVPVALDVARRFASVNGKRVRVRFGDAWIWDDDWGPLPR